MKKLVKNSETSDTDQEFWDFQEFSFQALSTSSKNQNWSRFLRILSFESW